jgi:hypothetical protein
VFALFEAKVRKINEKAKQEIEEKLMDKFKTINNPVNGLSNIIEL